jgi:hypothetical protein
MSGTDKHKGVPMAYTMYNIARAPKKEPFGKFIDRMHKEGGVKIPSRTLARTLAEDPWYLNINEAELRNFCLGMDKTAAQISLLLNIPKMRIAAWKAHRTMGTY